MTQVDEEAAAPDRTEEVEEPLDAVWKNTIFS